MPTASDHMDGKLHELALNKMIRILGEQRARRLMGDILTSLSIAIQDADDLLRFGAELSKRPGFEGAVGAMLSVQAVMHGADAAEVDPDQR
ncbi:MAG: hypothetical protein H0T46_06475 [Deltaproteobacteria bacterium]|nr:hypothetical protein [Deltaproteobacteria bacterium]